MARTPNRLDLQTKLLVLNTTTSTMNPDTNLLLGSEQRLGSGQRQSEIVSITEQVSLPDQFRIRCGTTQDSTNREAGGRTTQDINHIEAGDRTTPESTNREAEGRTTPDSNNREVDLQRAIFWLRQEIVLMKTDSRALIHQFLLLGSSINDLLLAQCKCNTSSSSSSSLALASSCHSLDQDFSPQRDWSPMSTRDVTLDFTSVSSPCTPTVDRDVTNDFTNTPNCNMKRSRQTALWSPSRTDPCIWYI